MESEQIADENEDESCPTKSNDEKAETKVKVKKEPNSSPDVSNITLTFFVC